MTIQILQGDALQRLRKLPDGLAQCAITSPPYFGLRDYEMPEQIGLEASVSEYVERLVVVFRELWRVLRADGTLWVVIGDSYSDGHDEGYKRKDLLGIPWELAIALRSDGWYLRSDVIWSKTSLIPQNVKDRPTTSHEYVFMLSKSEKYFYDHFAVMEKTANGRRRRNRRSVWEAATSTFRGAHFATFPPELIEPMLIASTSDRGACGACGAPVQRIVENPGNPGGIFGTPGQPRPLTPGDRKPTTQYFGGNHGGWEPTCSCYEVAAAKPCIVIDPFAGSGTTGEVALKNNRDFIGIELNPEYVKLCEERVMKLVAR